MNNELVAWMSSQTDEDGDTLTMFSTYRDPLNTKQIPLYTHPAELTDEEIYRLLADSIWAVGLNTDCLDEQNWADGITVARAILRKAQEK